MLGTSASYGRKLPGFELWGALLMNPQRGCLEPVLATAGVDYAWHWRGYIASAPRALVARRRQQRLKDGRGADLENAVSEYCRHFCSG